MKAIYQFYQDCGRMGELEGLFIAERDDVEAIIGNTLYFNEVLGKHSEIEVVIDKCVVEELTDDQDFIVKFEEIMGTGTISGINPLNYV